MLSASVCNWTNTLDPIQKTLYHAHRNTIRFLKQKPQIMVTEADNGKKPTVCLYSTYTEKMQDILDEGVKNGTYTQYTKTHQHATAKKTRILKEATSAYNDLIKNLNFYVQGGSRTATTQDLKCTTDSDRKALYTPFYPKE